MNDRHRQQGRPVEVQVSCAPVMFKGLKGEFHAQQYALKASKCPFDAGFDLYPASTEPHVVNHANGILYTVDTFLNLCFPVGTVGLIAERSSSMTKLGCARVKPGVIDSGYIGEIKIQLVSLPEQLTATLELIKACQKDNLAIAQMLIVPVHRPMFAQWDDRLVPPGRGTNGFGSTDIVTN